VLECVINVSEGTRAEVVSAIAAAAGPVLLDVHSDPWHNRSVLTLGGADALVCAAAREVAGAGVALIDLRSHAGAHPRLGAVDVVPFVPLGGAGLEAAVAARDAFALWAGRQLGVPCFVYGPERSLPDVRRDAFSALAPDVGPSAPHPTAGAIAVGARPVLVAYNVWLAVGVGVEVARQVARALRAEWPGAVRALGLDVGGRAQVSCNLVAPGQVGPAAVFDVVEARAEVDRTELVGLVPSSVLAAVPSGRWAELDLSPERTIEARLSRPGR
jgi:glutamate formiminotransferase